MRGQSGSKDMGMSTVALVGNATIMQRKWRNRGVVACTQLAPWVICLFDELVELKGHVL